jgi:plasmid stabilization system protein ParE
VSLPANARVRPTPSFERSLTKVYRFLESQDAESAPARYEKLQARMTDIRRVLAWNPASGRPARFMEGLSAQGRIQTRRVVEQAHRAGFPELRELLVDRYVLVYAHNESEVILLAIKHQRQLAYGFSRDDT